MFAPEHIADLPGPEWLARRRDGARERALATAPPTRDEEVWRYSRVDELDLERLIPASSGADADPVDVEDRLAAIGARSALVHLVDGHLAHLEAPEEGGLEVGTVGELGDGAVLAEPDPDDDLFTVLNDAGTADPILVRVRSGAVVDAPVVVVNQATTGKAAGFPRVVIDVGDDATVTVVELQVGGGPGSLSVPILDARVGAAARVAVMTVQDLEPGAWQIGRSRSLVGSSGSFTSAVASFGGDYVRLRTDCRLEGRGADGNLLAAYLGSGDQMLDFRTFQDHAAPDTTSDLVFKGALAGSSRSVYTGLIRVRPEGRGTNAFQTNRNLKLSEDAWAESVPNLEIENNEVHCSHASTVGPVDEEQRFYLESRGVPPAEAEQLIVGGFFDEVLSRLPGRLLAEQLAGRVDAELEQELP